MAAKNFSDTDLISALYRGFLGRDPEPEAIASYGNELASGALDARTLVAKFVDCEEYRNRVRSESLVWVPPGHFYSPIVDTAELRPNIARVFNRSAKPAEIDLNEAVQLAWVPRIRSVAEDLPFPDEKDDKYLYYFRNGFYSYGDGSVLATMIRHLMPRKILEFGSGFSSCLMIDVNRRYFAGAIDCTFVDPYPETLLGLLGGDQGSLKIVRSRAQDVDLGLVRALEPNDILFIDSTHVAKGGSDVNFHFFETLPALKAGVFIHFHDIFYPFEYPEPWFFDENRSWNEIYVLRAFLMHNSAYKIQFFNDFMARIHPELMATVPRFGLNSGGAIWLQRT
jgi:hypothetical protein